MTDLRYLAPTTLDEAIGAYAAAGSAARILAGGTDLLVQMRAGSVKPGVIVDIKKIAEMTKIEETADGGFRVGAAVSGASDHRELQPVHRVSARPVDVAGYPMIMRPDITAIGPTECS